MKSTRNAHRRFSLLGNVYHRSLRQSWILITSAIISAFGAQAGYAGSTLVTDAVGTQVLWTFDENLGVHNLTSKVNQVDGKAITQTWDNNNNLLSRTDEEGRLTRYTYNAHNQKTSMIEADGTANSRTTSYQYVSADIDLITKTTLPSVYTSGSKVVENTYDDQLNVKRTTVNGYTLSGNVVTRVTEFEYDQYGKVTQIEGPRSGISDITTFSYYNCNTGAECGQLQQVTNALGHTTTYDRYDANARLLQSTDANGIITTNTYHPRGWLLTRTQTAPNGEVRTTSYAYDNVGQMVQTTSPDGIVLDYEYDAAHDLRAITDSLGNRIEYQYDPKGNRNLERTKDPSGVLVREVQTVYDIRNFVKSINAVGSVTQMVNDAVGNLTGQTDPNENPNTSHQYDALDRLQTTLDSLANSTNYTYNVADQLIQVATPNGATTHYEYDDLGNLIKETSPDRGVTSYTHDESGNVLTQTDARGITISYTYDALNRLTDVRFPDASENLQYSYDTCPLLGVGRLCATTHAAGSEAMGYDSWGNVIMHTRKEAGLALNSVARAPIFTTHYAYDTGNRLVQITYPSGRVVNYARDAIGRLTDVNSTAPNGEKTSLLSAREYRADGLWTAQDYGNGVSQRKEYDQQGRLTNHLAGEYQRNYDYDANGNILDINGSLNALYEYDPLDRLVKDTASDLGIDVSFEYDANGNRIKETDSGNMTSLTYEADSNRSDIIGGNTVSLDDSGRTLRDEQGRTYQYNDAGRLEQLRQNSQTLGEYQYNANQLRTLKRVNSKATVFHYDLSGNMLAESDLAGNYSKEYVYADGERIALFDSAGNQSDSTNNGGSSQSSTVYEDAEDGTIDGWNIYDKDPAGATITNVFDTQKNSQVIELAGDAKNNGYRLGYQRPGNARSWANQSQSIIQWEANFNEDHTYFIGVETTQGFRYITYRPIDTDSGISSNGTYIYLGLGSDKRNGNWHTITRDLNADLKRFEPNNEITEVNGFLVRGSGRIDNVRMLNALPVTIYEDAESGTIDGWDVYDRTPAGATITNVFDNEKNSQVIELAGDAKNNGYRLGYQRPGNARSWANQSQSIIQWEANFNEDHTYFVGVETTQGFRYITYRPIDTDSGISSNGTYIYLGLGSDKRNGNWHMITRDLAADIQQFEPNNELLEVNGLLVRGSGRVDNVRMLDALPGNQPASTTVHYYINDHLSTPQRLLDKQGEVSWQAGYEAFGEATVNIEQVVQNHRFPGQYYDQESGLHYNWNRYYDPSMGRYVTSDPIGLNGGINTFGYVGGNPLTRIDIKGLSAADVLRIRAEIASAIQELVDKGYRRDGKGFVNGYVNNFRRRYFGEDLYDCFDQVHYVNLQLGDLKDLDDNWTFGLDPMFGHVAGKAVSDNPNDPTILYDPWWYKIEEVDCDCE